MRLYLAAPYGAREYVRPLAEECRQIGFEVTSSWLNESHEITPGTEKAAVDLNDETVRSHVLTDFNDIDRSELLVLFTSGWFGIEGGGGRHVETGYALARNIPVVVVGEPENVFHRMGGPQVEVCDTWHEAVLSLADRKVHHLLKRESDHVCGVSG